MAPLTHDCVEAGPRSRVPVVDARLGSAHSAAILLRLVARRHVDLHRVSSALCR